MLQTRAAPPQAFLAQPFLAQAAAGFAVLLLAVLTGCGQPPSTAWSGYAEGDFVYVAAPIAGRLDAVSVQVGQMVQQGDVLFRLDGEIEKAARAESQARLLGAGAQADDLSKGKRAAELAVITAQLSQAQASATLARSDLERQQQLLAQGFVARARAEDANTTLQLAQARVAELTAAQQVAQLPARSDERKAAQAATRAAQEVLNQSSWRSDQKQQSAPVQAQVSEVFFQVGEYIAAGQPVLALLPPRNIKARFFVAENELARLQLGQLVRVQCDACGAAVRARISRIASQPEYTPPVIYSNAQRAKLVYLVEALPEPAQTLRLKPGQPLDVFPMAAEH